MTPEDRERLREMVSYHEAHGDCQYKSDYRWLLSLAEWMDGELELARHERSSAADAANVLLGALGWESGGLGSAAREIVAERDRLSRVAGAATAYRLLPNHLNLMALWDALQNLDAGGAK